MFKSVTRFCTGVAAISILAFLPVAGQDQVQDINRLQRQSVEQFQDGNFRKALEGFSILRDINPGNPTYTYYTGVCMVELNRDTEDAVELLYGAAQRDVPVDVYYYLGLAYQRIYNFREAQEYFKKFKMSASRQELKAYDIDKLISDCRTAREMTSSYNPYEVMNVTFIDLYDSVQFSQVRMKGGQLERKPRGFFSEGEERDGLNSLMFMPVNAGRGDYAYFAGYQRNGRGGSQLYRVRMGHGRTWGDPEEIRKLNTDGNELLPYFDPIERDLYFASSGREGIGGLDLYRSHYDQERDEWSEPINLGFPINSVMDEYLLLPGADLGMVMFFTNRQSTDSSIAVYRVHVSEPKKKADPGDAELLRDIAGLGGVAEEVLADLESVGRDRSRTAGVTGRSGTGPEKAIPAMPGIRKNPPAGPAQSPATGGTAPESRGWAYQEILSGALQHQAASDSLKDLVTEARMIVRESHDPNDRWVWQKQIMVWEKKAQDEEEKADHQYAQLGSTPGVKRATGGRSTDATRAGTAGTLAIPGVTLVDTVMGDIVVYRYDDAVISLAGEPGDDPSTASVEPVVETSAGSKTGSPVQKYDPVINRFDILENSPYNTSNPIPLDVSLPQGTFYRIQLGAFSSPVAPDAFRGISPVTGETVGDKGMIKYYAGKFSRYQDVSLALSALRSSGYEDAFIVAWYNGVKVTTGRAKQLEQ